jgi:hypothetical protein
MNTARSRRLVAATVALIAVLPASYGVAPAHPAPTVLSASGTWDVGALDAHARTNFLADAAQALPAARPVLTLIDGSIAVDGNVKPCAGLGESCSFPEPAGSRTRWGIHLATDITGNTYQGQRFIVLHEIGHAVWDMVFTPTDQQAFVAAASATLHGKPCRRVRSGRPCAAVQELFADEFARWAGGFKVSMSCYETPALVGAATFGSIVQHALAQQPAA